MLREDREPRLADGQRSVTNELRYAPARAGLDVAIVLGDAEWPVPAMGRMAAKGEVVRGRRP